MMSKTMRSFTFFWAVLMLLSSILACDLSPYGSTPVPTVPSPTTLYVATTGHDTATCGAATAPCLTVTQGVHRAVAGSTIHIGAGTFLERAVVTLAVPLTLIGTGLTTTFISSRGPGVLTISPAVDVHAQDLAIVNTPGASSNAIQVGGGNASIELSRVNLQNNAGTALNILYGSLVTVSNSLFTGNHTAINNAGGVQVTDSTIFQHNVAVLYSSGVAAIDGATISGNGPASDTASSLPVIWNSKNPASASAILSLTHSTVSNTTGVALMNDMGGRTSISDSSFSRNDDSVANSGGSLTLQDSLISDSTAINQIGVYVAAGSGVPAVDEISRTAILRIPTGVAITEGATARLENVTIGGSIGPAINNESGDVTVSYSTIVYNAYGARLAPGGTISIVNSIIALNNSNCTGFVTSVEASSPFACQDAVTAASLGLGGLTPVAGTQVYPLLAGSPAIDAARGACPATDQRGGARPAGAGCDVGAYELGAGLHLEAATPGGPTETPGVLVILPSDTPTATVALAKLNKNANCRKGPGTGYDIVTSLTNGTQTTPDGRDSQSLWLDVLVPNTQAHCWVLGSSVDLNVPLETLAVLPTPPLPDAPGAFTDKASCQAKLKSLSVKLTWTDAANASGYHLYRSGNLLQTFGANVTTYTDGSAPLGKDLLYELEAFNANGSSARVQTTVGACK